MDLSLYYADRIILSIMFGETFKRYMLFNPLGSI
jgi:hypothetical protein